MTSKEFKNIFDEVAKANGFSKAFGGWYKETLECIAILELQKSNFGDYYLLNIKIFIQGVFDRTYFPNKELIKSSLGHINSNETKEYMDVFEFDEPMNDSTRKERLEKLFICHIVPFTNKTLTREGIQELIEQGKVSLLPAVKEEFDKLSL
jgi:hypothetical protein